jgi:hypothetical protein
MTRIYRDAYERPGRRRPEQAQLAAAAREADEEFDEDIEHEGAC